MKILSHEKIPPRVLIKKIKEDTKSKKSGLVLRADADELPRAEVVMVSDAVRDIVSPGDKVYYMENMRGRGKVIFNGQEHWIVDIGNLVSIYESYHIANIKPPFSKEEVEAVGFVVEGKYDIPLFDTIFRKMPWYKLDEGTTEVVLSCRRSSFILLEQMLSDINTHMDGQYGEFKNTVDKLDIQTLAFRRGSVELYAIVEDINYDIMWPYKTNVIPQECVIINT